MTMLILMITNAIQFVINNADENNSDDCDNKMIILIIVILLITDDDDTNNSIRLRENIIRIIMLLAMTN